MKIVKELRVKIPAWKRDPSRLIPRIVHQTYFEPVTKEKYPNFSRLVESWKQSGWDYKFYTDEDIELFLSSYFPSEVREAYDAIIPGAYKADLFRYCVLLIRGGIYADVDVLLSTDLDKLLQNDIGFMVPVDEVSFVRLIQRGIFLLLSILSLTYLSIMTARKSKWCW
jgi:mannosyltransferase OCH1-like enzyme